MKNNFSTFANSFEQASIESTVNQEGNCCTYDTLKKKNRKLQKKYRKL